GRADDGRLRQPARDAGGPRGRGRDAGPDPGRNRPVSNVKIRKELGYGVAAGAVLLGAAYVLAIGPQADATAQTLSAVEQTRTTNQAMAARVPALKAELGTVAEQVASLQELSRAVPAQVDQPGLYAELEGVAGAAGLSLQSVTLETPI